MAFVFFVLLTVILVANQRSEAFNNQYISIYSGKFKKLKLFFEGTRFFFMEEDMILKFLLFSVTYGSRSKAMQAFNCDDIAWIERVDLNIGG